MKVLINQLNGTPGDIPGNVAKIKDAMRVGFLEEADLIVTPELGIPGYLVKDMMYQDGFVKANLQGLAQIAEYSTKAHDKDAIIVVGYIDANQTGRGKPFRNMAAVIQNGCIIATYAKQLIPFYDVFDEGRYFEPGTSPCIIRIKNENWGLCICEDVWGADKGEQGYNYSKDPVKEYAGLGVKNLLVINASPFAKNKVFVRDDILTAASGDGKVIYCNTSGGQDDLVFEGSSSYYRNGYRKAFLGMSTPWAVFDTEATTPWDAYDPKDRLLEALTVSLRDYVNKSGFKSVVVGSSGGIDSALVLAISCMALGPQNVHAIRMPSALSSPGSLTDAKQLHDNLGCWDYVVPISHMGEVDRVNKLLMDSMAGPENKEGLLVHPGGLETKPAPANYNLISHENIQARMRGMILMHFSNAFGALLVTTGNKSELAVGYCTLYGDMCGGFALLSDLYKTEVYGLALHINKKHKREIIPRACISKPPSAELAPGQKDTDSLPQYVVLDSILKWHIEAGGNDFQEFKESHYVSVLRDWLDSPAAEASFHEVLNKVARNEFKRKQAAIGPKVSRVAFGSGRRYPIVGRLCLL